MKALFFASGGEMWEWLEENHESAAELWVGLHRRARARPA
jgi:hypothetical protein